MRNVYTLQANHQVAPTSSIARDLHTAQVREGGSHAIGVGTINT